MPELPGKLREIAWNEICPWLLLTRCVRIALMIRVLLLGAVGLVAVTAGWIVLTSLFPVGEDPVLKQWRATGCQWVWQSSSHFTISPAKVPETAAEMFAAAATGLVDAPITLWKHMTRPFVDMFQMELTFAGWLCLLACGAWEVVVWGLIGGAITRISALCLSRGEAPDLGQAVRYSARMLLSYTAAPLMALTAAGVFAVQLMILGALMRIDLLAMFAGLAWPFVLILGFLMAIILVGVLIGWPMMWATISVEGTDAFDAVSRSYAYTYQSPLRLLWYVLLAGALGALGMFVVKFFALATVGLGDWSIRWGLDDVRMEQIVVQQADDVAANGDESMTRLRAIGRGAVNFWKSLLTAIAAGYQAGYLWAAAVGIYLLMRRDIDAAELDEIFIDEEEPEFGMPPLEGHESGVPEVATDRPAQSGDTSDRE